MPTADLVLDTYWRPLEPLYALSISMSYNNNQVLHELGVEKLGQDQCQTLTNGTDRVVHFRQTDEHVTAVMSNAGIVSSKKMSEPITSANNGNIAPSPARSSKGATYTAAVGQYFKL
jgi:hypothetical protein